MILIFRLILKFILVLQIRELTLISILYVVLLEFCNYLCKKFYGFVNSK